jgi:hypothetical protein
MGTGAGTLNLLAALIWDDRSVVAGSLNLSQLALSGLRRGLPVRELHFKLP